jgi:hypothetical protein
MSELKSRPPVRRKPDLDAFISGAEERMPSKSLSEKNIVFPWEETGVRKDVTRIYNLRLSEPYLLKLKYIAEYTPDSMQKFCLRALHSAIDSEIERLIK